MENETLCQSLKRIQQEWGLTDSQIAAVIHMDLNTYLEKMAEYKDRLDLPTIPRGMDTAVPVVSIYKSLARRFPETENQVKWLFEKNNDFGGNKPIDITISSVDNLFWVSYYLDSSRT
jgi:hypothetical protein